MTMQKYTEQEILEVIEKLQKGYGDDEELEYWFSNQLAEFMPGISDLIFYSNKKMTPQEILQKAREKNKPILL